MAAELSKEGEVEAHVIEEHESYLVRFHDNDPTDPLNWSKSTKWGIVMTVAGLSAFVQLATVIAAPVSPRILSTFDSTNELYGTLLVTIWELGEVTGPLLYGPLSEKYGRLPVFHVTNAMFVCFSAGTALSTSIGMLIAFRFLTGTSVAAIALGSGVVGDLFTKKDRGAAMSLMMVSSQIGPALGPILGSYLGESKGWRWTFWLPTILMGATSIIFVLLYRETYRVVILKKQARQLRHRSRNSSIQSEYEAAEKREQRRFAKMVLRPAYLIARSPILLLITLYTSFFCGLFYLMLTSLATVYQGVYGFSEGAAGLAFLGLFVGMMLGCAFWNVTQKYPSLLRLITYLRSDASTKNAETKPEQLLVPSAAAGVIVPAGFFLFGWSVQARLQWIAPVIGSGFVGFGWFLCTVSVRTYIINVFGIHAVSAVSAMLVIRNAVAAVLPLAGPPLFSSIGFGWGCSTLGFLALLLVPVPILMMRYGERMRLASSLIILE